MEVETPAGGEVRVRGSGVTRNEGSPKLLSDRRKREVALCLLFMLYSSMQLGWLAGAVSYVL